MPEFAESFEFETPAKAGRLEPEVIETPFAQMPPTPEPDAPDPDVPDEVDEAARRRAEFERMAAERIAMQDAISREPHPTVVPEPTPERPDPEPQSHAVDPSPIDPEEEDDFGFRAAFQQLAAERDQPAAEAAPPEIPSRSEASAIVPGPSAAEVSLDPGDPGRSDEPGLDAAMGLLIEQQEAMRRRSGGEIEAAGTTEATGATEDRIDTTGDTGEFERTFPEPAAGFPFQGEGDATPADPPPDDDDPTEALRAAFGELARSRGVDDSERAVTEPYTAADALSRADFGSEPVAGMDADSVTTPMATEEAGAVTTPENVGEPAVDLAGGTDAAAVPETFGQPGSAVSETAPEQDAAWSDDEADDAPLDVIDGAAALTPLERYAPTLARVALPLATKIREFVADAGLTGSPEVASLTFEHGFIKIVVSRGLEVLDYKVMETNPRVFREGMVSDPRRAAVALKEAVSGLKVKPTRFLGAVPGYQTNVQDIELPLSGRIDANMVLPREARKVMGVSADTSYLAWHRLPDDIDNSHWLVVSATKRSVASLTATAQAGGVKIRNIELRAFALARAVNLPDVVIAWAAADGCDAVVVRDWEPMVAQSAYWGADPRAEGDVLINRITEVAERATLAYGLQNPESPLSDDTPLVVTGTPVAIESDVPIRVSGILRRPLDRIEPAMHLPEGFPVDDLVVNIGLSLGSA